MNIQILRYSGSIRYFYLAEYKSIQVNDGSNFQTSIHEENGEHNCEVIPNTLKGRTHSDFYAWQIENGLQLIKIVTF